MPEMNDAHFHRLDLNLLTVFDSVMIERSVTKASNRLNLTQGAVSHALARLRTITGDQLFIRSKDGMLPTPRALALSGPVRGALASLEAALSPEGFDPNNSHAIFRIATTDYFTTVALPRLIRRIEIEAPGVSLRCMPHTLSNVPDLLHRQEADLAIGFFKNSLRNMLPSKCQWQTLWDDQLECVMNREHALASEQLSFNRYLSARHLQFSLAADACSIVDKLLHKKHATRTVSLTVSHYLAAPPILQTSDMIMTVPSRIARLFVDRYGLYKTPLPIRLPTVPTQLVWNAWTVSSAPHEWLRSLILEVCSD